jgi:ribosomal protein S18 acetylase RimI-like enzyme
VLIRPARPSEFDAVGQLTVEAYTVDGHLDATADYVEELRDAQSRAVGAQLLVALEREGAPVLGTVTFCLAGTPYAELARCGEAEFRMLAVAPEARKRGVGHQLVAHCVELAKGASCSGLVLCSLESMVAAQRIYGRFGFQRTPERDWEAVPGLSLLAFLLPL